VPNADPRAPGCGRPVHSGRPGVGARQRDRGLGYRGRARRVSARGPRSDGTAHALDAIRRTQAWFDRHLRLVE
jgi:hypothetical protein